ncbi:MAG: PH domain-containing protein [Phycisphaerales bacterium]
MSDPPAPFDPASVTRPDPLLMKYYFIVALMTVFAFPIVIIPLYFRYHTLRYVIDDEGISMSVGVLFRREVHLTYRRIQDIHVTRGLLQRWLGLASVAIQTASGSSSAEMTIEGVRDPDGLRDFLYRKMRGVEEPSSTRPPSGGAAPADEALALLREIRDGLRARPTANDGRTDARPT